MFHYDELLKRCIRLNPSLWSAHNALQDLLNYQLRYTFDEALKFIEDITDTYNDLETKLTPNKKSDEEWQKELEAKDNEWREKYKARFFDSGAVDVTKGDPLIDPPKKEKSPEETITFDDLFESEDKK